MMDFNRLAFPESRQPKKFIKIKVATLQTEVEVDLYRQLQSRIAHDFELRSRKFRDLRISTYSDPQTPSYVGGGYPLPGVPWESEGVPGGH